MKRRIRCGLVLAVFLSIVVCGVAQAAEGGESRYEAVARRLVRAINARDADAVQAEFAQVMRDAFGPDKATPFFDDVLSAYGKIERIGDSHVTPPNQAVFVLHFERGTLLDMKFFLDESNKTIGLWLLPHVPSEIPVKDKHDTALRAPFEGDWLTFWGGDTQELNQHHGVPNQQYAFDFVAVDSAGADHNGDGSRNEDFFAFGRRIVAPAPGEVTDVIEGVRDNAPGSMNPYSALGNAVFIKHAEGEISVLAHLKLGSVQVKVGDKVAAGRVLGLCGNSGNSSQPHLHYHLQNTPVIQDGTGIQVFFEDVTLRGPKGPVKKGRYSPVKGAIVVGAALPTPGEQGGTNRH